MLKDLLIDMAYRSGVHRLFTPWYGGHTSIVMLHRVHPGPERGMPSDNLQLTPEFLEHFIRTMQGKGWRFISLDHLVERFDECAARKRNLVITLDDGYLDNHTHAWPLFRALKVPFIVYVTNSFPDGGADLWWYTVEDLLLAHGRVELEVGGSRLDLDAAAPRVAFGAFRGAYQSLGREQQKALMASLLARYPLPSRQERLCMSWEEIREMARDELCTVGCHTLTHRSLAKLPREEAAEELARSREEIEREISRPVRHLSYPYGRARDAGAREEELARESGFLSAVTTRIGNVHPGHRNHLLMLPRIPLYQWGRNAKLSPIFQSGMYSALTDRFRKVVTD